MGWNFPLTLARVVQNSFRVADIGDRASSSLRGNDFFLATDRPAITGVVNLAPMRTLECEFSHHRCPIAGLG